MLMDAIVAAVARQMVILVDGFTVTVATAITAKINRGVLDYCVFSHRSAEHAHCALLDLSPTCREWTLKARDHRYEISDPSCAALQLRVGDAGAKSWHWRFYWHGRRSRLVLGVWPAAVCSRSG